MPELSNLEVLCAEAYLCLTRSLTLSRGRHHGLRQGRLPVAPPAAGSCLRRAALACESGCCR